MTRSARVLAGVSFSYIQLAVTTLIAIWYTPFLLRHVGTHDFGIWSAALPILGYVGYAEFGVLMILQRDVSYQLGAAGGDPAAAAGLADRIGQTLRMLVFQFPVLAAVSVVMFTTLSRTWGEAKLPFAVILVVLVGTFPLRAAHAALVGLQDLAFLGRLSLVNYVAGIAVSVVLLLVGCGLVALATSWAFTQVVLTVSCVVRLRLRFPTAFPRRLTPVSWTEVGDQLHRGFSIIAAQVAAVMLLSSDVVVIAAMLGADAVVPYTITDKLLTMFGNIPTQITTAAMPALSELRTSPDRHRLADVCTALVRVSLLAIGLVVVLIVFVNGGFVAWWVGKSAFAGPPVSLLICLAGLATLLTGSTNYPLYAFGAERRILVSTALAGGVAVGLGALLTRWIGLAGPPVAMILGSVLVGLPINFAGIARETGTSLWKELRELLPFAWRFAALVTVAFFAGRRWPPTTFVTLAAASIGAVLVYVAVMFPLALRHPVGMYVRPRLDRLRLRFAR